MYKTPQGVVVKETFDWAIAGATAAEHGSTLDASFVPASHQAAYSAGFEIGTDIKAKKGRNKI